MKAIPSVYRSWPTVPLQFGSNAIKTAKECADEKSYWGKCHEVYSTFLVSRCLKSAELAKQRTAAGNQNQLSHTSVTDITEEYIWRERQNMPLQHQKSVHHIILPIPKLSVLQLKYLKGLQQLYIYIHIYIPTYSQVYI